MRVRDALVRAQAALRAAGSTSPVLDAEVLLAHVLDTDRAALYAAPERELTQGQVARYRELVAQRLDGVPVAYLTGRKEFMGLDFQVNPAVLIPRPETELMVERALALLQDLPRPLVVDVGTGSGAVAVSIARHHPGAVVYAVDIAAAALEVAGANARRHGVTERVLCLEGDLLGPLPPGVARQVDLICANLPYVPSPDLPHLPRDVRHEPRLALDGGLDGLGVYRRLVPQAARFLRPGGHLLMEIDPRQAREALSLVPAPDWDVFIERDLSGKERLVVGRYSEAAKRGGASGGEL
ncbi:MAG: peptide chain release factor N(5)-glutamine methyltransferase [Desulfotomaculales bacterium]